ncbi:MAG: DUF3786 domain-containing protein, partial [Planctomycetes bacterium]|nr:DUF3786 domain-containing protein [Planctomycetota bacterium]
LSILGRDYRVSLEKKSVEPMDAPPGKPNFFLTLVAVAYLIHSKDIPLAGELVSEQAFPNGPLFFRGLHALPTGKILKRFGGNRDDLAAAAARLVGRRVNAGDIAFVFPLLPRLPVTLVLWLADDEFPARLSFLFDRTACEHLPFDALLTAVKVLEDRLLAAAQPANGTPRQR